MQCHPTAAARQAPARLRAAPDRVRHHPSRTTRSVRGSQLLLGLLGVGVGVGLLIRAELGVASWDVLHVGLAERTGATVGQVAAIVGVAAAGLALALGERARPGSLVPVAVVGPTIDATMFLIDPARDPVGQATLLLLGVTTMAIGVGMYVSSDHGAGPSDLLFLGLARRGLPVWGSRLLVDGAVVLAGWSIGGPVGLGTVVVTLLLGPLVGQALRVFDLEPARARTRERETAREQQAGRELEEELLRHLSTRGEHRLLV